MTLDAIKQDINKRIQMALNATAQEITVKTQEKYQEFIDEFYNSYFPVEYNRTGKARHAWEPITSVSMRGMTAGIKVNGDSISEYPTILRGRGGYPSEGSWVFDNVFVKGVRHHPPGTHRVISPMGVPPKQMMDEWFETYANTAGEIYFKYFQG